MAYWDKQIHALTGRALQRYGMLAPGDRVLVGVSGGKDSLTLLDLMLARQKVIPFEFEVTESALMAHPEPASRALTSSASARQAVSPGDSMPNRFTSPAMPCASGPSMRKSAAGSPGPASLGRTPL